jgi:hypothetical protein
MGNQHAVWIWRSRREGEGGAEGEGEEEMQTSCANRSVRYQRDIFILF